MGNSECRFPTGAELYLPLEEAVLLLQAPCRYGFHNFFFRYYYLENYGFIPAH